MATGEPSRSQASPYMNLTLSVQPSLFDLYYEEFLSDVMSVEESSKGSKVLKKKESILDKKVLINKWNKARLNLWNNPVIKKVFCFQWFARKLNFPLEIISTLKYLGVRSTFSSVADLCLFWNVRVMPRWVRTSQIWR